MLKLSFWWCIYHVKGTITVPKTAGVGQPANSNGMEVVFKTFDQYRDCISETNNTQIDNTKDIDAVMSMYNLIEYGHK